MGTYFSESDRLAKMQEDMARAIDPQQLFAGVPETGDGGESRQERIDAMMARLHEAFGDDTQAMLSAFRKARARLGK